ncbi:hypothetical protein JB92DRAFT_3107408 [Gautieria morchelliformis]|nr:hypothetical protein JB92DRAFT_3107408 [Gautieria morchelliformis]
MPGVKPKLRSAGRCPVSTPEISSAQADAQTQCQPVVPCHVQSPPAASAGDYHRLSLGCGRSPISKLKARSSAARTSDPVPLEPRGATLSGRAVRSHGRHAPVSQIRGRFSGQADSVEFRDPHYWLADGKGLWQCQACQDARWRPGPRARVHEDTQVHRRNVQYRMFATALQHTATTAGDSDGAAAGGASVPGGAFPEYDHEAWDDAVSENALDGAPQAGPSLFPSGAHTLLERSLRDSTVCELTTGLGRYLGLRDVPAQERSDDGHGERSDASSDGSADSSGVHEDPASHGRPRRSQRTGPQDDNPWYPWLYKVTCSLDILMHVPRSVFSDRQVDLFLWMLKVNGIDDVPSVKGMKTLNASMQHLCGIDSIKYTGALGHRYYVNNLAQLIAQEMANPRVHPWLHFYPEESHRHFAEARQGERWLNDVDGALLTPMVRVAQRDFYMLEPTMLKDGSAVVPFRWYTRDNDMCAKAWRLHAWEGAWVVLEYEVVKVGVEDLLLNFVEFGEGYRRYGCPPPWCIAGTFESATGTQEPWSRTNARVGNPSRERARGHRVLSFPVRLYCDDTSGNMSKKWNKHNSFLFTPAGLEREHAQKEYNVHFLSTSNIAPPLEMLEGIVTQLSACQAEGIWALDCVYGEMVLVLVWILALLGDNPMQSDMACSDARSDPALASRNNGAAAGQSGGDSARGDSSEAASSGRGSSDSEPQEGERTRGTRGAHAGESMGEMVDRVRRFMSKGAPCNRQESMAYLWSYWAAAKVIGNQTRITRAKTGSGIQDTYQDFFIKKLETSYKNQVGRHAKQIALDDAVRSLPEAVNSPVWRIEGLDPHRDTPVEILHVILLGFVKYFWRDAVEWVRKGKRQALLESRLSSCDVRGLGLSPLAGHTLVQWASSLTGQDFRGLVQVAPFILYDLIPAEAMEAWLALGRMMPLVWQPVIPGVDEHLEQLERAIHYFLDCTEKWTPCWFNKPKFHILLHLTDHIWQFAPPILFATEQFESFNAVIRAKSIHSNRHAPSRDIANAFAQGNRVHHLMSRGYVRCTPLGLERTGQGVGDKSIPAMPRGPAEDGSWRQIREAPFTIVPPGSLVRTYLGADETPPKAIGELLWLCP